MRGRVEVGTVLPTGPSRRTRNAAAPLVHRFSFRNYLSEWWLFGGGREASVAPKFGLANCTFVGIVSVSRSVQSVIFARARTEARLQVPYHKPGLIDTRIGHLVVL
jgi:hypothetical protein